jgi:hypothetical protein
MLQSNGAYLGKHTDKHPSKKAAPKAPSKAGVMLYEDTTDGRKLLVAYNEGRFSKDGRYLVLPKGGIDKGETPLRGGLREFSEETGFPLIGNVELGIEGFLSEEHILALERGETLEHITNPKFPGIEIVRFAPHAYPHKYHARNGTTHRMVMFGVEIKGMDCITPYLKNPDGKTTKQCLDKNRNIPRFPTFLSWIQQGFIPAEKRGNDFVEGDGKTAEDLLPETTLCDAAWFADKVKKHAPGGVIEVMGEAGLDWEKTRQNWQKFCEKMEGDKDYKPLRDCFGAVKKRMEDKGFVRGDHAILKFDEKDCPLFWYTEGGFKGKARAIFAQVLSDMESNHDYARAHAGRGTKFTDVHDHDKAKLGQIAGFLPFISKEDRRGACDDAKTPPRTERALYRTRHLMLERAVATTQAPSPASGQIAAPVSRQSARR